MAGGRLTERADFRADVRAVARGLLGAHLRDGPVLLRITEVEAYCGPADTACHTARGRTPRNAAMWGPVGHAYVYLCYGLHWMLNVVAGEPGCAVLVRACAVLEGADVVAARRAGGDLAGPGKVGQALGLTRAADGRDLLLGPGLRLEPGSAPARIAVGRRIGVDYAAPADRDAPLRFAIAGERAVSRRAALAPEPLPEGGG